MQRIAETVALMCSQCGRTFEKSSSALEKRNLVACPHCATLQAAHLPQDRSPPRAGMVGPTYRKGP